MTLLALAVIGFLLAGLYATVTFANLAVFAAPSRPPAGMDLPAVSILIPARDEAANIGPAIDRALAGDHAEIEVVVLDDGSTDATARIVAERATADPRVRLVRGGDLPAGWIGKQNACRQLAAAARHPILVFVDADVRLAPDAVSRMVGALQERDLDLLSGFPRQLTATLAEKLTIPQIFVLLLGYLPLPLARTFRRPSFAAGCGQLMVARADIYHRAGGHARFATKMHDGLLLPKLIRETGGRTDLIDATPLATCRMYTGWAEIWSGFSKNATEGMAKPVALPIWTVLLGGGHVLPYLTAIAAAIGGGGGALRVSLLALALLLAARIALAIRVRQSAVSVVLHPVGICILLALQWTALFDARRGRRRSWRGRTYDAE